MYLAIVGWCLVCCVFVPLMVFNAQHSRKILKWPLIRSRFKPQLSLSKLVSTISEQERAVGGITKETEKYITFANDQMTKTPCSVLYIHGYSATRQETLPVPLSIAQQLGANYYATRLTGHGLDGDALASATEQDWLFDAKEAWHVASQLGEKIIVISSSTGGALATWLAQQPEVDDQLAGMVLLSPNYRPRHWASFSFLMPWARVWIPMLRGQFYGSEPESEQVSRFWTCRYPVRGLVSMARLVQAVLRSNVESITTPSLFIYCDQDRVVNARITDQVFKRWGSKVKHRMAIAPVPEHTNHVITGDLIQPATNDYIIENSLNFIRANANMAQSCESE